MNWTGFFHAIRNYLVPDWTLDAHNFVFLRLFTRESNVTISSIEEVRPTHTIILKKNTCIQKRNMWLEKINMLFFFDPCNEREHTQPQRGPLFPCFLSCHRSSNSFPCWDNLPPSSHSNPTIFFFFSSKKLVPKRKKNPIKTRSASLRPVDCYLKIRHASPRNEMSCFTCVRFSCCWCFYIARIVVVVGFFF